jgi:hypothetical protein
MDRLSNGYAVQYLTDSERGTCGKQFTLQNAIGRPL